MFINDSVTPIQSKCNLTEIIYRDDAAENKTSKQYMQEIEILTVIHGFY